MAKDNHRGAGEPDQSGESSHAADGEPDQSGESSHAADEPTAVWDMEALRKAGLSEVIDAPETPATAPATPAVGIELERPSIIIDQPARAPAAERLPRRAALRKAADTDVGWAGLIIIAALLGAIAYVVMRLLR